MELAEQFKAFKFGLHTEIKCGRSLPTHLLPISVRQRVKLIPNANNEIPWNKHTANFRQELFLDWHGRIEAFKNSIRIIKTIGPAVPKMPTTQNGIYMKNK